MTTWVSASRTARCRSNGSPSQAAPGSGASSKGSSADSARLGELRFDRGEVGLELPGRGPDLAGSEELARMVDAELIYLPAQGNSVPA